MWGVWGWLEYGPVFRTLELGARYEGPKKGPLEKIMCGNRSTIPIYHII